MTEERMFEDDELTHEIGEIPEGIYDDGRQIITREITPKTKAPIESQKGPSRKVLWTVVSLLALGLVGIGLVFAISASQTR